MSYGSFDFVSNYDEKIKILKENYELLRQGMLPQTYKYRFLPTFEGNVFKGEYINWRELYIKHFGFPLLSADWIKPLARFIGDKKCLEIMAGNGSLTYFLKQQGVQCHATDNYTWKEKTWFDNNNLVEKLDCIDAISKYGDIVSYIICSWPYMDNEAYKSLLAMRTLNDKCRMIYIGEWMGGCTANDRFFDAAEFLDLKTFSDAVSKYSCWEGIQDHAYLVK